MYLYLAPQMGKIDSEYFKKIDKWFISQYECNPCIEKFKSRYSFSNKIQSTTLNELAF